MNILSKRYSRSNTIDSFSFLDIEFAIIKEYFNRLTMQNIKAQSYNNKLQVISAFLCYLQVTGCISEFSSPIALYYKKNYPTVNEIDKLDQKLDLLSAHLRKFPEQLRIMSLILLFTGIRKGQLFLLRNADFYYKDEHSWMKVPDTTRSIPVPDILHWLCLLYTSPSPRD